MNLTTHILEQTAPLLKLSVHRVGLCRPESLYEYCLSTCDCTTVTRRSAKHIASQA